MRYRRRGLYDYEKKGWRTFYENNDGKIIFDKGIKTNRDVKKIVSANLGEKRKTDIINKKQSKTISTYYLKRAESQQAIDKILKKKKLTVQDKKELTKHHAVTPYKSEIVNKKIQPKRKKKTPAEDIDNILEYELFCAYHNSTSPQFFASKSSKRKDKKTGRNVIGNYHGFNELKQGYNRLDKDDDIFIKFLGLEKKVKRSAFRSVNTFNEYINENFIRGRGKIDYTKGTEKIIIMGIKKK